MTESSVEASTELVVDLAEKELIRVLHVDDEAGFLKVAEQCLEMEGAFHVETASSVDEAIIRMKKKTFDVIVSDYQMPEKDGLEFLKELRDNGNSIPFIMFTGRGREEVAIKALNLGADQYLNKTGDSETVYGELAHGIRKIVKAKRDEERVRESEEKYRSLFENARDVTLTLDLKGKITSINKAAEEYGLKKDKIIGRNMLKYTPKKYWPKLLKELTQLARGKSVEGKIEVITPKGKKTAEYNSNPIIINSRVVGVQSILKDITERKKAEEKIRESEERLRAIFASSPDSITVTDLHGNIMECNQATVGMLGFSSMEELVGKSGFALVAKKEREKVKENLKKLLEQGSIKNGAYIALAKDGREFPAELSSSVIKDSSGKLTGFVSITRDITERMKIEEKVKKTSEEWMKTAQALKKVVEELKDSEQRLKILFEFAPDAYYLNDLKGNFVDGNKAAEELTGYSRSELVGKSFLKLKLLSQKQVMKAAKLLVKNALGKSTGPDEFVLNRKDGTPVSVEIRTFPVKIKDQTLVLGIARDISERKRADAVLKAMNEKLRVVGRLTRHDVRNKLSGIAGNVFLAKRKLTGEHESLKYLREIGPATSQIERIFDFARTYEKLGIEELVYIDVEKSLKEAVMQFSDLHNVKVVNGCHGLTVLADSLLRQLLYNLIHNSLRHGEKVVQIRIHYEGAGKDQLKLVYEDDGIGIPKNEKEKIFTEGYGKGIGYGLYLIRKMCEVYGWTIRETGKHGKGARFTITIPRLGHNEKILYKLH